MEVTADGSIFIVENFIQSARIIPSLFACDFSLDQSARGPPDTRGFIYKTLASRVKFERKIITKRTIFSLIIEKQPPDLRKVNFSLLLSLCSLSRSMIHSSKGMNVRVWSNGKLKTALENHEKWRVKFAKILIS